MSVLEVKNLTHTYDGNTPFVNDAVKNVSFTAEKGEILGIIGHTGSGKSTLVQHLNGLLKPTSGTIDPAPDRDVRKKTGLVFQYPEYQLFEETVAKDVAFGPKNLGMSGDELDKAVKEALELVGLPYDDFGRRSPFELSGGQKRRAAIAGVIAMKPEVLILDEPTAGLNPRAHNDILEMVETIHRREKNIIFLVSHNMNDIARMSDKVIVMDHGRKMMDGTPSEVFSHEKELREMGLALPDSMELVSKLRNAGMEIPGEFLTMEAAADGIAEVLKKKGLR